MDSCQIKDILKGSLRFNQSQLEAEENEEIAIADDHYTSTAAAESARSANNLRRDHRHHLQQANSRRSRDSDLDGRIVSTDEKGEDPQGEEQQQQQEEEVEEQQEMAPPEQQVDLQ